jgi:hypothetical protein
VKRISPSYRKKTLAFSGALPQEHLLLPQSYYLSPRGKGNNCHEEKGVPMTFDQASFP